MMTAVDDAYARYDRLHNVLTHSGQTHRSNPTSQTNRELGLIGPDTKRDVARNQLNDAFREMFAQAQCLGIIDLCATFEDAFRRRVRTAIGEAQRAIDKSYGIAVLTRLKGDLLRDPKSFDSLASIFDAVERLVPHLKINLHRLRHERNRLSHNSISTGPPSMSPAFYVS